MQSNGSAIQTETQSEGKSKKTPPKPPKRVSFDLKYRQIGEKPSPPIESPNPFLKYINGVDENSNDKKLNVNKEQLSVNSSRANSVESKGDTDKTSDKVVSPAKVNTNICDTGQTDNEIRNKNVDNVQKNDIIKQSRNELLRQEFVKTNENLLQATPFTWGNRYSEKRSSVDSNSSGCSPPNLQIRLSESQSKIAKLQQSLPKLSDATVDALKNKYSPASFGYPKNFAKSTETTKIFSSTSKNTVEKEESKEVETEKSRSVVSVQRRHTFRTELYIQPVNSKEEDNKKEDPQIKLPTVQTKFISSEIFPKDQPVKTEIVTEECMPAQEKVEAEPVFIEDTSEQSSDTLTESEDSQNIKYRKSINSDLDTTPSKLQDIENNNSTDIEEPDTSSFTSDITYCEVYEEEFEAALPDKEIEMEDPKKKSQKKRSNSFKRIFGFGSSKDKKKEDKKKTEEEKAKNTTNSLKKKHMLSENAQNEAHMFDRNTSQRHTIAGNYNRNWERRDVNTKQNEPYYTNSNERYQVPRQLEQYSSSNYENSRVSNAPVLQRQHSLQGNHGHRIEERLNKIQYDLLLAQQTNQQLNSNIPVNSPLHPNLDEYVCMDNSDKSNRTDLTQPGFINAHSIDKYIDTTTSSSSISTLESDTRNIFYENTIKSNKNVKVSNNLNTKIPVPNSMTPNTGNDSSSSIGEKCYERPKFVNSPEIFTTTPKRAQGPQLIKPKAIIPINTERALPNPYRTIRDPQLKSPEIRENVYGNLPTPENPKQGDGKETHYGKPVPPIRKTVASNETYGNIPNNEANITVEDEYGTVYDSLVPVGAQLKITKPPIINGGKNMKERSRSVSPSQRHKAVNLSSSQSFNRKSKLPVQNIQASPTSPTRKELEATKLRLPLNRDKLEPKLKSPTEERKNLPKKIEPTKKDNKNNSPSHQKLEIEIDYPENNLNEIQDRKDTPEKTVFSSDNEPSSPKRSSLKRQTPVSPNRPKSFTHSTPKGQAGDFQPSGVRSPLTFRSDSPVSVSSHSNSISSLSSKSKPITADDVKDLKNTEVYYYEQTTNQNVKKEDVSPDQSPQQVLTQATVHQPKSSPREQNNPRRTPVDQQAQTKIPMSPLKAQNMQSVEAYYWQQVKKEQELYNQHVQMLVRQNVLQVPPEYARQQAGRSRSLSTGNRQPQRRSASLPRDCAPPNFNQRNSENLYGYARAGRQDSIPEGRPVNIQNYGVVRQNNNFVRGAPQRNTLGPINNQKRIPQGQDLIYENYYPGVELRHQAKGVQQPGGGYAPIFKRGSLVPPQLSSQETSPQVNKKVSFSSAQSEEGHSQNWPTKNGFTQSPPTRRVDKKTDSIDDEVFLPDNMKNISQQQMVINLSKEPLYVSNKLPPVHPKDQIYISNLGQREPMYGRTSNSKQVTVSNKVCDMYGQIHDASIYGNIQKTGVIYGQLQTNPVPGSPASLRNQYLNRSDPSFTRGTRLTASFNDMRSDAPRRPLPHIPGSNSPLQKLYGRMNVPVSESESGSEAGEVQRILAQKERRRIAGEFVLFSN